MSSTNPQQYTTSHATPAPVAPARTNGLAVAALVLGIVWVYWIGSILAVIFGAVALHQIEQSREGQGGRGMAVAGLVLGLVGVGVLVLVLLAKATSGVA
jgi:hypothetical protein